MNKLEIGGYTLLSAEKMEQKDGKVCGNGGIIVKKGDKVLLKGVTEFSLSNGGFFYRSDDKGLQFFTGEEYSLYSQGGLEVDNNIPGLVTGRDITVSNSQSLVLSNIRGFLACKNNGYVYRNADGAWFFNDGDKLKVLKDVNLLSTAGWGILFDHKGKARLQQQKPGLPVIQI